MKYYNKYKTNLVRLVVVLTLIFFILINMLPSAVFINANSLGNVENIKTNQEQQDGNPIKNFNGVFEGENSGERKKQQGEQQKEQEDEDDKKEENEKGKKDKEETPKLKWDIKGSPDSEGKGIWFAEEAFYHEIRHELYYDKDIYSDIGNNRKKERQFLKVVFSVDDDETELEFLGLDNLINGITVYSSGSVTSMLDVDFINEILYDMKTDSNDPENSENSKAKETQEFIDKYIFIKDSINKNKATLYIPLKPLMANMTYNVSIGANIVIEKNNYEGNSAYTWEFNTMAVPFVPEDGVIIQSVIEDYDIYEPIIITGRFFYPETIRVYFNDIRAYRVRIRTCKDGKIENRSNREDAGDKKDRNDEIIEQHLEIYLPRGRRNKLEPGLYNIIIENSSNHSKELYGALSVVPKSHKKMPVEENKYSTITPYGFIRGTSKMELVRLDHKEPIKEEILKRQLTAIYNLKSPIVETNGEYYSYIYALEIPYESGNEAEFKVLRYNEILGKWTEIDFYINNVDKRVVVLNSNPGIFVVVESK